MDVEARPDDLEEARHDVDLNVERLERAEEIQEIVLGVARERDDHTLDIEAAHDLRQLLGKAEHRQVMQITSALLGRSVHESEQIDPVLRMLEELSPDQLADVARADDDRSLEIGRLPPRERTGS